MGSFARDEGTSSLNARSASETGGDSRTGENFEKKFLPAMDIVLLTARPSLISEQDERSKTSPKGASEVFLGCAPQPAHSTSG